MSALSFRRFTSVSSLREIAPQHLAALLHPHEAFLRRHHVELPDDPGDLNYEALAVAVLQPHADMPPELVDALWHVHEMATPEAMEALLDEALRTGINFDGRLYYSPADVAAQVWAVAPDLLRRTHAEFAVRRRKTFESFRSRPGASAAYQAPDAETLAALEADVARWYRERRRGPGARVFLFEHEHETRLVIRHGGPYRREGTLDNGEPGSVHFRPMGFGAAILDRRSWELRVNVGSGGKREMQMYRETVGRHLFGQHDCFSADTLKYTLEPLRRDGRRSLVCADVPGLRHVRLTELRMHLGGAFRHARVEQADDVFLALEERHDVLPSEALLSAATFEVRYADSPTPRSVMIRHGNVAQYARESDADLVETFLRNRGFVKGDGHAALVCA